MPGPCQPWIQGSDILDKRGRDAALGIDVGILNAAAAAASDVLFELSGRKFPGLCRAEIRPSAMPHGWGVSQMMQWYALMVGTTYLGAGSGYWGWGMCAGGDHGGCTSHRQIDLGVYPIAVVHAVTVDGTVLDPSAYRVDDNRWLVRLDGEVWPMCQNLNAANGSAGTWSVDVEWGEPVPQAGMDAAVSLALEMSKARTNNANLLPQRVTNITRLGVSWTILDPMAFLKEGKTGLYDVDLFLSAFNPYGQRERPRVLSPDTARRSRVVGDITSGGTP